MDTRVRECNTTEVWRTTTYRKIQVINYQDNAKRDYYLLCVGKEIISSLLKGLVTCSLLSLFTVCLSYQMPSSVSLGITNKIPTQTYDTSKCSHMSYTFCNTDCCKSTCTLDNRKRTRKKDLFLVLVHFLCLTLLISLKEKTLGWRGGMQNGLLLK